MHQSGKWRHWMAAGCIGIMLPVCGVSAHTDGAARRGARQAEFLDRGLVAVQTDAGVFLSWRLLGNESYHTGFNIYRDGRRLNRRPLTATTNYLDTHGTASSVYTVRRPFGGREQSQSTPIDAAAQVLGHEKGTGCSSAGHAYTSGLERGGGCVLESAKVWDGSYLSIPLVKPADGITPLGDAYTYRANDASVGDLNGDGEYEIVLKWDPTNQKDNSQSGYTGEVFVDA